MEGFRIAINGLWQIANLSITFPPYTLKLWYFPAFAIVLGLILKMFMVGGEPHGGNGIK